MMTAQLLHIGFAAILGEPTGVRMVLGFCFCNLTCKGWFKIVRGTNNLGIEEMCDWGVPVIHEYNF